MRFLFIVDDFLPHSTKVAAKMMHELALEFMVSGHEISVLTPAAGQAEKLIIKNVDGVNTLFFRSGRIKNTGKVRRAINESLLSKMAWSNAKSFFRNNHFDGIIYYSPSIFFGPLVRKLKDLWKCKSYLILRDIFPQWTVDNGLMREGSLIHYYFRHFEKINYDAANTIGVMSPSNLNFFKGKEVAINKFEVLFNWAKLSDKKQADNRYRKELGLENKTVFFYGGNIGKAQNMRQLVDLAKSFKEESEAHFLFVGKGDEVELVKAEKEKYNISNLTYLPAVNQITYFEMLTEFDVGLFSLHPDHKTHNFPGKLLGYMGHTKPILGCVNSGNDLKEIINKAEAGFIVDSGDLDSLYRSAFSLYRSTSLRKFMGENGRRLLQKQFSIESAARQIITAFKN